MQSTILTIGIIFMTFGKMMTNQLPLINLSAYSHYLSVLLLLFISITVTETGYAEKNSQKNSVINSKDNQLQQLLEPFTKIQSIKLPFHEKRFSLFLKQAVEYQGIIEYTQPDLLVKQILSPSNKKFIIEGNQLTIINDNIKTQELSLDDYPQFMQFKVLYSALLKGKASELTRYYRYDISKLEKNKFQLTLKSLITDQFTQNNNTRSQQIDIIFADQKIRKITITGFAGERSEIIFDKALLKTYLPADS